MSTSIYPVTDGSCTALMRESHYRGEKRIAARWCGSEPVVRCDNPITGELFYMCHLHWTAEARRAADRMALAITLVDHRGEQFDKMAIGVGTGLMKDAVAR